MIVLTILKWIGIVLLWILGILLALILLLLFSPIRYHVNADIDPEAASEGDKAQDGGGKPLTERAHVSAGVRYLLSAVRARFDWPTQEGQDAFSVSVLFFRVFPRKEKKASGRRKRGKKGSRGERREDLAEQSSREGDDNGETGPAEQAAEAEDAAGTGTPASDTEIPEDSPRDKEEKEPEEGDPGDADRDKAGRKPKKRRRKRDFHPQIVIKKIYYTICGTCAKIGMVRATIQSSVYFRAKRVLLNELKRVLKQLLPRGTRVVLTFGAEDPATTGDVMSVLGMLYPVLCDRVQVTPVFDEEVLYGEARVRGTIIPAVLLFSFLRCYFNRDIRKLIRRAKKIKEVNHGRDTEQ